MGKFSELKKGLLAAALAVVLVMTLLPGAALADSTTVIDRNATGTLCINLQYGGSPLAGGVFDIYHVATLDDSAVLSYTLTSGFDASGVDINAVKTASEVESAAKTLAQNTSGAAKATLTTNKDAGNPASVGGLRLGVYLVVQTGAPAYYAKANPFLVFIPMANEAGTGWDGYTSGNGEVPGVYTYTAYPKTSFNPPGEDTVDVKVTKIWDDSGLKDERPDGVNAGLYRNGKLYETRMLSDENNWQYIWRNLSAGYAWTVDEIEVPNGYSCIVEHSGNSWTLTNSRGDVPLGTTLTVTKVWEGDDPDMRPDSILVTLLRDGEAYETVELTADNKWTHTWAGLSADYTWTVTEIDVPESYTSTVATVDGGFRITNTYGEEISGDGVPGAPQTGLIQWPIPVLLGVGILLIASGLLAGRRKKKYGK